MTSTLRLEAAFANQDVYSLRNEESLYSSFISYDILAPVRQRPLPTTSEMSVTAQTTLGFVGLRVSGFIRNLAGLRLPALKDAPLNAAALISEEFVEIGSGSSKGVELSSTWRTGNLGVIGSYRWSLVRYNVGDDTYAPRFHREHELEVAAGMKFQDSQLSARVSARSGQPYTPIHGVARVFAPFTPDMPPDGSTQVVALGGTYNSRRLPKYIRADVGWRSQVDVSLFGRRGTMHPYVAVVNIFNAKNVLGADIDERVGQPALRFVPQLPILPFAGLEFRF
jgi:outer membrane receptor protein involved in Fe transport